MRAKVELAAWANKTVEIEFTDDADLADKICEEIEKLRPEATFQVVEREWDFVDEDADTEEVGR